MFPVSRTTVSTLFATSADPPAPGLAHTPDRRRPCLLARLTNDGVDLVRQLSGPQRTATGRASDGHDLHVVRLAHPLLFLGLQLLLDAALVLVAHLVHPDGPLRPSGEELADDGVLAVLHVLLARELHQPGAEQDAHELGRAHDRGDV